MVTVRLVSDEEKERWMAGACAHAKEQRRPVSLNAFVRWVMAEHLNLAEAGSHRSTKNREASSA
jgi:hypothetical protein